MKERERELIEKGAEAVKFEIKRFDIDILEYPMGVEPWEWQEIMKQRPYLPRKLPVDYFLNKTNIGIYYKSRYPDFERALRKALDELECEQAMIDMSEPPVEEEPWKDVGRFLMKEFSVLVACKPKGEEEIDEIVRFRLWRRKKL